MKIYDYSSRTESSIDDEKYIEVICDGCHKNLGNGDESVYQIGNEVFCENCFISESIEIMRAKKLSAGEYACA